jgi:AraC-like DNA-binding protein
MTRVPVPRVFDTGTALAEPVPQWEAHNAEALIALRCEVPTAREFRGREANVELDRLHLARVSGSPHAVRRDAELIERTPTGSIAVYALMRGDSVFESMAGRHAMTPGQLLIWDADRPFRRTFGHGLEELAIRIPQDVFARTSGLDELSAPIVVDAARSSDPYARALIRLVGRALRAAPVPADEAAVVELVSVLVTDDRSHLTLAHRAAAKAFIEENLADPSLTASRIAQAIGVSDRTLSRVFAEAEVSVPQYVLARRLDMAYALLSGPQRTDLRTADVAGACGFTSMANFSSRFRERFGTTAGDVRRTA